MVFLSSVWKSCVGNRRRDVLLVEKYFFDNFTRENGFFPVSSRRMSGTQIDTSDDFLQNTRRLVNLVSKQKRR